MSDGVLKDGNILKVNGFLNHLIDIDIAGQMDESFIKYYEGEQITMTNTLSTSCCT